MSKRILMEVRNGVREIALMEGSRLLAFFREQEMGPEAEQIYLGVVERIVKGMEAAFVRLEKDTVGFLPFSECHEKPKSGERLLVQVKRPPVGEKAAYLTADIALAGRYAILTPLSERISLSKRLEDSDERARLKNIASRVAPAGMGLVVRAESAGMDENTLRNEVSTLFAAWQTLEADCASAKAPCLLKGREDALGRLMRDEHGQIEEILANSMETLPASSLAIRYCENPFELYSVRARLKKSLERKVWLDCGGFLVIDRTEAMTVIDVNSGKFTGGKSGTESTFLRLNQEAAREIARLLRLRGIGGIVLIDFVDMQEESSRQAVIGTLSEALRDDPVKTAIHGFTSLGLMEMTRKKTESGLTPPLPCPCCHGTGYIEEA